LRAEIFFPIFFVALLRSKLSGGLVSQHADQTALPPEIIVKFGAKRRECNRPVGTALSRSKATVRLPIMKAKIYVGLSLDSSTSAQSSANRGRGTQVGHKIVSEKIEKKIAKMSVQLKDTPPSILNPGRNTTHASVVARDLGRVRR